MKINEQYANLKTSYLFSTIAQKVACFKQENPHKEIIRLGIGDVTLPLSAAVVQSMRQAALELGDKTTFRGYGQEQGYAFLRQAVARYYETKHVSLADDEIFISDGAKSDLGNILDLFGVDNTVIIPDPVYPVYVDTNIMAGRNITFINGTVDNAFLPLPDENMEGDIIYLCSPNNPTGAVYSKEQLQCWVDFALDKNAVILFDAAYEAFVGDSELPTSIYQIEGAKECAIEFCSLSKTAGFTGTRCGYTVVPLALMRGGVSINQMWLRRQTTKFNGVPYIVQRGAEAVFSEPGWRQARENIAYYIENAQLIRAYLAEAGIWFVGGEYSPYVWLQCPGKMTSWQFFDHLLTEANVVGTPGCGFGVNGEGFFRLTAFGERADIKRAMQHFVACLP